jgi:RNA polymerase sigma factor (sigma-70 family)
MTPLIISNSFPIGSRAALSCESLTQRTNESALAETYAEPGHARIALVEDNERAREALVFQLSTAGYHVVPFASGHGLLAQSAAEFDCIIADIFLPGMNGLQLQERLINTGNSVSIVFITGRGELAIGVQAMKRGAIDVLEKPIDDAALLDAVMRGIERSRAERVQHEHHAALQERFRSLPARQRDVFTLITAGLLNKQVAAELGISERTVKVHRERLRRRMGVDSLAELARMAETLGLQPPSPRAGPN